jgi:hypothetical protein
MITKSTGTIACVLVYRLQRAGDRCSSLSMFEEQEKTVSRQAKKRRIETTYLDGTSGHSECPLARQFIIVKYAET